MSSGITVSSETIASRSVFDYDGILVLGVAEHSISAYQGDARYRLDAARAGYHKARVVSIGPAQYAIASSPQSIVLSIVGTNERKDWRYNFASFRRVHWPEYLPSRCEIGWGWFLQAERMLDDIVLRLVEALTMFPRAKLDFGGHSQGGSVCASLVPAIWHRLRREGFGERIIRSAFLLEPARPGDVGFMEFYDERFTNNLVPTYTVINVSAGILDIVPRVWLKRMGNRHVGEVAIHSDDHLMRSWDDWQAYRDDNPVGHLAAWRIVSRIRHGVRAHSGASLVSALGMRAEAEYGGLI